jgi:hypothetical protein
MTIANGNTALDTDLNAMTTAAQTSVATDNAQLPLGFTLNLAFATKSSAFSGVPTRRSKTVFVAPCDVYLETLGATSGDETNPSTVTVTISGDGALGNWPTKITGNVGASPANMTRLLYDNTKTRAGADFAATSRAFRVYPKGTTITVQATSTSAVTTGCLLQLELVFRQFFARE